MNKFNRFFSFIGLIGMFESVNDDTSDNGRYLIIDETEQNYYGVKIDYYAPSIVSVKCFSKINPKFNLSRVELKPVDSLRLITELETFATEKPGTYLDETYNRIGRVARRCREAVLTRDAINAHIVDVLWFTRLF